MCSSFKLCCTTLHFAYQILCTWRQGYVLSPAFMWYKYTRRLGLLLCCYEVYRIQKSSRLYMKLCPECLNLMFMWRYVQGFWNVLLQVLQQSKCLNADKMKCNRYYFNYKTLTTLENCFQFFFFALHLLLMDYPSLSNVTNTVLQ